MTRATVLRQQMTQLGLTLGCRDGQPIGHGRIGGESLGAECQQGEQESPPRGWASILVVALAEMMIETRG